MNATESLELLAKLCDPLVTWGEATGESTGAEFAPGPWWDDEEGAEAPTLFHSTPGCRAVPDGETPTE